MRNFGVTTPAWDRLLGTYDEPGVVTVPRRMAPVWMFDESGVVRADLADDYIVAGSDRIADGQGARDRDDAFANTPPEL